MNKIRWMFAATLVVFAGNAGAQSQEMEKYLQGLSVEERAAFPSALQQSVLTASQDVLAVARQTQNPKIRNRAYSVYLLDQMIQRKLEAKEFALTHRRAAGMRARVQKETADFLEDLSGEVDRLSRDSSGVGEFAGRVQAIADHVQDWAGAAPTTPKVLEVRAEGKLSPTEENIEGPFYRPNAPFINDLVPAGKTGISAVISGRVLDTDGNRIAGALVDVWQADPQGNYDIADPKDRTNPDIPYQFRGRMRTDSNGEYSFTTLIPGNYEIGENQWRCKHIHYKVSAPGLKKLTTQLYFEGDLFNKTDPWWKASTTISLSGGGLGSGDGQRSGVFDIVLAP